MIWQLISPSVAFLQMRGVMTDRSQRSNIDSLAHRSGWATGAGVPKQMFHRPHDPQCVPSSGSASAAKYMACTRGGGGGGTACLTVASAGRDASGLA